MTGIVSSGSQDSTPLICSTVEAPEEFLRRQTSSAAHYASEFRISQSLTEWLEVTLYRRCRSRAPRTFYLAVPGNQLPEPPHKKGARGEIRKETIYESKIRRSISPRHPAVRNGSLYRVEEAFYVIVSKWPGSGIPSDDSDDALGKRQSEISNRRSEGIWRF